MSEQISEQTESLAVQQLSCLIIGSETFVYKFLRWVIKVTVRRSTAHLADLFLSARLMESVTAVLWLRPPPLCEAGSEAKPPPGRIRYINIILAFLQ